MSNMKLEERVKPLAEELTPGIVETYHHLHVHPELSFEEVETSAYIKRELEKLEIEVIDIGMKTGVVGLLRGGGGPCVALRADIDALPVQEDASHDLRSGTDGVMHACGHDTHMASLIGAARILAAMKGQLPGDVKFLFQPAEEQNSGAKQMLARGALDNPKPGAIFGLHNSPDIPTGQVGVKNGPLMAAVNSFYVNIYGKGGHGGLPHRDIDPVVASAAVISSLQSIVSRNVESQKACVVSVCSLMTDNGFRCNIIPDVVRMAGTCRYFDGSIRHWLEEQMRRVIENTAAAYGCRGELIYEYDLPATVNASSLYPVAVEAVKAIGAEPMDPTPSTGGEDFSIFAEEIPGFFFWLGVGNEALGCVHPWHSPHFKVDERALPIGAACYAMAAIKGLEALRQGQL